MEITGVKVTERRNGTCFPIRLDCHYHMDTNGYAYGDKQDFCGSSLEVEAEGIVKHKWSKYPDESGEDYGVICPVCGMFTVIPDNKIPRHVREKAKDISLTHGRLTGFVPEGETDE